MLRKFAHLILKLLGWKLEVKLPEEKKFILIGAPHTSNWDFPFALLAFWSIDRKVNWVGKVQLFKGPFKYLFDALGGIPVDRSTSHGYIKQIAETINNSEQMILAIAPEGTRSRTEYWKSGFYYIAHSANVPICLGFINYRERRLGFSRLLYPGGDIDADMKIIADFYHDMHGKHPQNQGPVRIKSR